MDAKILLSASWLVVTLIYLYDDVLRICSGDLAKSMASLNFNIINLCLRQFWLQNYLSLHPGPELSPARA